MKYIKSFLQVSALLLFIVVLSSCGAKKEHAADKAPGGTAASEQAAVKSDEKPSLPMQYQRPAYMIGDEIQVSAKDEMDEVALKVGATIRSTSGPQPLWDILKRLAAMKNMNISWESDVNQNVLVDVDISANDDYFKAINNLLRQVDYYHEIEGNTIVVKYKETRQYQIGMPFIKQLFETGTGGNVLGGSDTADNIEGTIRLDSKGNEYDFWAKLEENLNAILDVWTTEEITETVEPAANGDTVAGTPNGAQTGETEVRQQQTTVAEGTRRRSGNQNLYTIDKSVGLITVTAPQPLLRKVDSYIESLKNHLYKQITIEAKIIEVVLRDASSIGINWSEVLKDFNLTGFVEFGSRALGGQVYPYIFSEDNDQVTFPDGSYTDRSYDPTRFVSKVAFNTRDFSIFLNALQEEGQTKVLSNPKISVMNGQPALITVGRNVTYIDSIESDRDNEGVVTFTVNTERVLSGIGMAITATITGNDEVIMNLVPVTSELQEPIEYRPVGNFGGTVGLPIINIREMSTTVKVKNGEMLVIGGLISDDNDETGEFLPVLGNIPLVKYLFGFEEKVHTKRELIILLKPVVI